MRRTVVLVPVVAALSLTSGAHAAPACNVIEDAKGDTFAVRSQDGAGAYGPQDDTLDVVSGDLASDGKTVTAVVRTAKFGRSPSTSPTGYHAGVDFLIGSGTQIISMRAVLISGRPDVFEVAYKSVDAVPNTPATFHAAVTGVVDEGKGEIRIHAPVDVLSAIGEPIKAGTKLIPNEAESATVGRGVPPITSTAGQPATTRGPFADIAAGGKAVVVGAKSCVVPGK